jgi:Sulfotransferase family
MRAMSRRDSPLHERMIFAFGARRSGTWWLQRILTAHPEVSEVPSETYLFELGIRPLLERFHHGVKSSTTVAELHADRDVVLDGARDFCDRVFLPYLEPGARYLSERSPGHAKAVDVIAPVYPDARLIHIIRDGRDVARSLVAREWGPDSVGEAAVEWRDSILEARAAAPEGRYLEVRYESLLEDLEGGVRALYDWLELPAGDALVEDVLAVARRPMNEDPKDPRIAHGKWRDYFSDDDVRAFEAEAGELLDEMGYERMAAAAVATEPQQARRRSLPRLRGRRVQPAESNGAGQWEVGGALAESQKAIDALLAALHSGDDPSALLDPGISLRIAGDDDRSLVGAAAAAAALREDPAWRGRQLSGAIHPGIPQFTLVMSYDLDGRRAWRTICAEIRNDRIAELTVYRIG